MHKKIFISYADIDKSKVRSIEKIIKQSKIFTPIIVADRRQALVRLTDKVSNGIKECDYFIPIITRKSISTQWINQEIGYAEALDRKKILPIVERGTIDKLKGFIHKQLDLSYTFDGNRSSKFSESGRFRRIAKILIDDLMIENKVEPKSLSLESLFPGRWKSQFDRVIEIKDGNKYFANGRHYFNLDNVEIDLQQKKIKFTKVGIGDNRIAKNDLNIIELGKKYEGQEENYPIKYEQIK